MLITKEITIDLQHRKITETLEAVQYDANTRAVKVTLLNGGESWTPPVGAVASVAFKKPDGTSGWYDKLPDGKNACTVTGNTVTAIFAPQMLTAAGKVRAAVIFQDAKLNQLATFVFTINVEANPAAGKGISNDYYNYTTMKAVNEAIDAALAALEEEKQDFLAKAEEALAVVHGAATENAPAIVCEATGEIVQAADASDRPFHGLTLYGKTTQNGTPTPISPVELVSVGAGGAINATIAGNNLCNLPDVAETEVNGITISCQNGVVKLKGTATETVFSSYRNILYDMPIIAGQYRVSGSQGGISVRVMITNANGVQANYDDQTFTLDGTETRARIFCFIPAGTTVDTVVYPMINFGSTALSWEPYKGQTLTVSTPNGLHGIPVSAGGNYSDEDGQQWICDEVDFARGVYVQRVYQETFALSSFTKYAPGAKTTRYGLQVKYSSNGGKTALCSVMSKEKYQYSMTDSEHWFVDSSFQLFIPNEQTTAFESNENVTVLYNLATPIETALSAQELAIYYALHSNKPNATVFNDAGAGMKIAYVADTKNYIDQKLAAISAAVLNA